MKASGIGTVLTLAYGTAEIVAYEGAWRTEVYRPFEVHPREPWTREVRERVMIAKHGDASPRHDKASDYLAACPCCWLNITHTAAKHAESTGGGK